MVKFMLTKINKIAIKFVYAVYNSTSKWRINMINAVSNHTISAQPLKPQAQSFGQRDSYNYRPRQSALEWSANQFAKGALISVVLDSLVNGYKAIRGQSGKISFNNMAKNAGFWGVAWIAMGLIFEGIDRLISKRR